MTKYGHWRSMSATLAKRRPSNLLQFIKSFGKGLERTFYTFGAEQITSESLPEKRLGGGHRGF